MGTPTFFFPIDYLMLRRYKSLVQNFWSIYLSYYLEFHQHFSIFILFLINTQVNNTTHLESLLERG